MHGKRRSALVLTLVVAAISLFAAACTSTTPAPGSSAPSGGALPTEAGKPKYGGTMRQLTPTPTDEIHLRSGGCAVSINQYLQPIWAGLLRWDPDNPHVSKPDLAESWSSPDGQNWVFKLRKDVVWHDGKPFTADDVVVTFDHAVRLKDSTSVNRMGVFLTGNGATYRAIDSHTVELKLKGPNTTVIPWLSSCGTYMAPKHVMDRNGGPQQEFALGNSTTLTVVNAVGTGPFRLVKHDRDTGAIFERHPNYWGRDASGNKLPFLDGLDIILIRDTALQYAAFRTNQIDMWPSGYPIVAKSDADKLKAELGDKVSITPGNALLYETLDLNNNHPLLKQRDMRWAINLIIDRQELAQRGAEGNFLPAFMDPELFSAAALPLEEVNKMPGFRQPKTEDHAEARRLLQRLGVTPQTAVELNHPVRNYGFPLAAAQITAKQLEPFGIKVRVNAVELASQATFTGTGNWDVNADLDSVKVLDPWFYVRDEADFSYRQSQPGLPWANEEGQKKIQQWMQQALVTLDETKRNAIYHDIQRYLYTVDTPHIGLGFERTYHMWWSRVKGYKIIGGVLEGLRHDLVWLDK